MKALLLITILTLMSCQNDPTPLETKQSNNPGYNVSLLFEKDGCNVYRFRDNGYYHYFTKCGETHSMQNCGKNCTHEEAIGENRE